VIHDKWTTPLVFLCLSQQKIIRWLMYWCTFDLAHLAAAECNLLCEKASYLKIILIIYTHNCMISKPKFELSSKRL